MAGPMRSGTRTTTLDTQGPAQPARSLGDIMSIRRSYLLRAIRFALQGSLATLAISPVARAEEPEHAVSVLEEVVVTAQRREQTLQDVPITV